MFSDSHRRRLCYQLLLAAFCGLVVSQRVVAQAPAANSPEPLTWRGLENVYKLSPRITSGSGPESDEAFAELARHGVKTVVSVDGARPQVELAHKHGLQYIHIPIGYEGLTREAELAIARVVRDCHGDIYIHCHHGKHRGPAAAAIACMAEGAVDHDAARHILATAGTGANYRGLWRDVAQFQPPQPGEQLPELREVAPVSGLVQAMSAVDAATEYLERLAENDFQPLAEHPDLAARHEALMLWEGFREAARLTSKDKRASDEANLHVRLEQAESAARQLRGHLAADDVGAALEQLSSIRASCTTCHEVHRDHR